MALLGLNFPPELSLPKEATSGLPNISNFPNISQQIIRELYEKRPVCRLFLDAAKAYGVPDHLLFKPDDLVQMAHVYKSVAFKLV